MTEELDLKDYYTRNPGEVRYNKKLPFGARLLWSDLLFLCEKKKSCWWPNSKFAELYGVSERTIINWLDALEAEGLITRSESIHPETQRAERKIVVTQIELFKKKKDVEEEPEPEENNFSEAETVSQGCEKNFTPIYSNSNNLDTKKNNKYKEFNKIQHQQKNVKPKFGDFNQRDYSDDFYTALEAKMRGSG